VGKGVAKEKGDGRSRLTQLSKHLKAPRKEPYFIEWGWGKWAVQRKKNPGGRGKKNKLGLGLRSEPSWISKRWVDNSPKSPAR